MGFFSSLGRLFSRNAPEGTDADDLARIRERSEHFRILLSANHQVLDAVTELSEAAQGSRPVTMSFIKARIVKAAAGTRTMVENLCKMHPGKYELLREALESVSRRITADLAVDHHKPDGPLILSLRDIDNTMSGLTGPKAAGMGELSRSMGLTVPEGFVVTAAACSRLFESGLGEEIARMIQAAGAGTLEETCALSSRLTQAVCTAELPEELLFALKNAEAGLQLRCGPGKYAVRSSALAEDLAGASFAGQYRSMLNVPAECLAEAYLEVVAGLYSVQAMAYREAKGMRDDDAFMAVCCMRMVNARAGGVLYTTDPFGHDPGLASIIATPGLPKGVADGDLDPDEWLISKETGTIVRHVRGSRKWRYREAETEGVERVAADGSADSPLLGDTELAELTRAARIIESTLNAPQDVEWAVDEKGRLFFLQCRPLELETPHIDIEETASRPAPLASGGRTGAGGTAVGQVFVIRKEADMFRFPDNSILAANTASPRYAPLIPHAAALVAEHGSKAGHLANVAREFGIPALFGIKDCVDILENAGTVTVDADVGCIYPGAHTEMLRPKTVSPPDSPIMKTLKTVLESISPLNLTDPDSPDFRPVNCWTIHDITRYCHEKGVAEMFGADQDVPRTSSARRLALDGRTMQYRVVDLEDCFPKNSTRTVELSDIDCPPMHAVWQGMTAVPWAGPPITGKGLMSVMAESAFAPNTYAAAPNSGPIGSYFLIGRHYCTLQSRFGCHFCTVEGFAGDRSEENYALMQFMGGAADASLRHERVKLCAETLERCGFITSVRGDILLARKEHMSRKKALTTLSMLGYMLMHTRQLDMAMGSVEMRRRYADTFRSDLARLARIGERPDQHDPETSREDSHG